MVLFYKFHLIIRELVDGDKMNREKKRLAEERQMELERQKLAARKRLEEGFTFDPELGIIED